MAYDWKKFEPFHFWCHKVLPLIYDDSLSYYETLCKLYALVTKLIELCNELIDAVKELNGRVTVLEQTVDLLNQELIKLKGRMDSAESKIETLEDTVNSIQTSITNIMNTLNDYGDRITQVETDVTEINTTLNEVSASLTTIIQNISNLTTKVNNLEENPYVLPIAGVNTLGGIKVGNNLTIRPDGTLDAQAGGGGDSEVKKFYFSIPTKTYPDSGHTQELFTQDNNYVAVYVKGNQISIFVDVSVKYQEDNSVYTTDKTYRETVFDGKLSECTDRAVTGFGTLAELVELLNENKILGNTTRTTIVNANTIDGGVDFNLYGTLSFSTMGDEPSVSYTLSAYLPRGSNSGATTCFDEFFLASGGTGGGGSGSIYIVAQGMYESPETEPTQDLPYKFSKAYVYYTLYSNKTIEMNIVGDLAPIQFEKKTRSTTTDLPYYYYRVDTDSGYSDRISIKLPYQVASTVGFNTTCEVSLISQTDSGAVLLKGYVSEDSTNKFSVLNIEPISLAPGLHIVASGNYSARIWSNAIH